MRDTAIQFQYRNHEPIKDDMLFHSHAWYEIYLFHGGKCTYLIGDRIYVLQPGDMFLMHGMTLHRPNVGIGEEYVRTIVHFEPSYIEEMTPGGVAVDLTAPFRQLRNVHLPLRGQAYEEMDLLLKRMNGFAGSKDPVRQGRFMLAFLDVLLTIYPYCQIPLQEHAEWPSDKERHVQDIVSYVDAHFQQEIDLDLLERELHLSKYYLTRIFKEVTGVTIFKFLYQRRVNEAKVRFLMDKQASVSEVGYEVGFKHPAHFSRVFKEQVGMTPEAFRRRQPG